MLEPKVLIERWRAHYNQVRPQSAVGYRPPRPEAIIDTGPRRAALRPPLDIGMAWELT